MPTFKKIQSLLFLQKTFSFFFVILIYFIKRILYESQIKREVKIWQD